MYLQACTWLVERSTTLWQQSAHPERPQPTIPQLCQEERLQPMPVSQPLEGYIEHTKRVSPPAWSAFSAIATACRPRFANRPVSVRAYADRVVLVAEG